MRHKKALLILCGAMILAMAAGFALAQAFTDRDWLLHRGASSRKGSNEDPGLDPTVQLRLAWVYPATRDMPAEIVVDNTTLPPPPPNATGQAFSVAGAWTYPATSERASGAWPPGDQNTTKIGDYVWAEPKRSDVLASIGVQTLAKLPNLGIDVNDPNLSDPTKVANTYKRIHDELVTNGTVYARWRFGTAYPANTYQGRVDVQNTPLAPNQRYAIYIRFPTSSTLVLGLPRPNTDHVMVRVSWGANPDDPVTSRIFMLDTNGGGGYWQRVRSGPGDDRYFPYNGIHPITVTLYTLTPDDEANVSGTRTIIPADAVRLVPEAMRGEIHAPAVSAVFPPGSTLGDPGTKQLTFFGRDETSGPPVLFPNLVTPVTPISGFSPIPLDPTRPPAANNPLVNDPSTSIRSAVFYCIEDAPNTLVPGNSKFGRLRWRYVARSTVLAPTTINDDDGLPGFQVFSGFTKVINPVGHEPYGESYHTVRALPVPQHSVQWEATLKKDTTYSVFVWIPAGGEATEFVHRAHYRLFADNGPIEVYLDQRNTDVKAGAKKQGMWRPLASGVRFPEIPGTPPEFVQGRLMLLGDAPADDVANARLIAADAVQFVPESQTPNSVVAAPLLAHVTWPSGTKRSVVYFATTDGHVWALDAIGADALNDPPKSTLTTAYWVYPSITNPEKPGGVITGPQDDPNYIGGATPGVGATYGVDGHLVKRAAPATDYDAINRVPALGAFVSSPIYVEVQKGVIRESYIVIGNSNGRIYAFSPYGRVNGAGEPFPATFATGDSPGIPGTSYRTMTWPTTARDKLIKQGASESKFGTGIFVDDAHKIVFNASLSAPKLDADFATDRVIAGAGDGHVYCIDMQDVQDRISNYANRDASWNTPPRWQYPDTKTQLDEIIQPGVLTTTGKYIFSAGGRVYAVRNLDTPARGVAELEWVYPFTSTPPGNPRPGDKPARETLFTAPAWRESVLGLNGGREVVFVANQDGSVLCLDATTTGGAEPAVIWETPFPGYGSTRASAVFLRSLTTNPNISLEPSGPAILLPLDNGSIIGLSVRGAGKLTWGFADAIRQSVSITNAGGQPIRATTAQYFRGGEAVTASGFVYSGDEGVPTTGESNGQMRAYYDGRLLGLLFGAGNAATPDEITNEVTGPDTGRADLRLAELWDKSIWDEFYTTKSPYTEWAASREKKLNRGLDVIEWGDTLYVAAWGAYKVGETPPSVEFRLLGAGQAGITVQTTARPDTAYSGPPLTLDGEAAQPWVAKVRIVLNRGTQQDPQTPGKGYSVLVRAGSQSGGVMSQTIQLAAGQATITKGGGPNPAPGQTQTNLATPTARPMAMAHPLALTSRGVVPLASGSPVGPAYYNIIGWTDNTPVDNSTTPLEEILANGNRVVQLPTNPGSPITVINSKDVVAPLGLIPHGGSETYLGVDDAGNRTPALFVVDRSNLFQQGQTLKIRVERRAMRWGWNPNSTDPVEQATGNVMNPLPWEVFPNTVPNVSPDYPDLDSRAVTLRAGGVDLAQNSYDLPRLPVGATTKNFDDPATPIYREVQLTVSVPKYQPANINRNYFDINGALNPGMSYGLLAPMVLSTGRDGSTGLPAVQRQIAPSAGYVGDVVIYVDSSGDGKFEGGAVGAQIRRTVQTGREEAYRQLRVGVGVPPDLTIRTEEETLDLGRVPHSLGFTPSTPFAPSGVGPYTGGLSPFDLLRTDPTVPEPLRSSPARLFAPFTVRNEGNVNLLNLRVAKVIGPAGTDPITSPAFWWRLVSDQVDPASGVGYLWAVPFRPSLPGAVGNLGAVTSLDHANSAINFEIDYSAVYGRPNFWPLPNPYVPGGVLSDWADSTQPRPTIHKARPGDPAGTRMTLPDTPYGDPQGLIPLLNGNGVDTRPKIGIAVPLGTPAGTYSAPIYLFEDYQPRQWRQWLEAYRTLTGTPSPVAGARDDDGILNTEYVDGRPQAVEAVVANPFRLKVTVGEARLTNEVSVPAGLAAGLTPTGSFRNLDVRAPGEPTFGANFQPAVLRDNNPANPGNILMFWSSNRLDALTSATPDPRWFLFYSRLNGVKDSSGAVRDWRFEAGGTRWWEPFSATPAFPDPTAIPPNRTFPSQASDLPAGAKSPLVPGTILPNSVRHATPALTQDDDDDPARRIPEVWLFWQGAAYKNTGAGTENATLDTRTFYAPLDRNTGAPDLSVNGGIPFSFLNDPALPKFAPKPLLMTHSVTGGKLTYLFWYGGAKGRTRIYYNVTGNMTDVKSWSPDTPLPMPSALQWVSDPVPVHRRLMQADGTRFDAIDLLYTGVLSQRKQPETLLTRYRISPGSGRLSVAPLPTVGVVPSEAGASDPPIGVPGEQMVRDGTSQTWMSRDLAWVYAGIRTDTGQRSFLAANGRPYFAVYLNGQPLNGYDPGTGQWSPPTLDNATGRLYYAIKVPAGFTLRDGRRFTGGQLVVDPNAGTISFPYQAPGSADEVTIAYTPQTMRVNATRNESGALLSSVPAGWITDPGFAWRPFVMASGANIGPVSFLDRGVIGPANPRRFTVLPAGASMPVTRLWTFYRKAGSGDGAGSAIYYKTMRLMVRLPRPVVVDYDPARGVYTVGGHLRISGNRGPVEVDWARGRLYFTEWDEGNTVTVEYDYARTATGSVRTLPAVQYRVSWGDETTAGSESTHETVLPTETVVNEGQISAFKDPFADRVWVFWASTRSGSSDLYYMALSPQFYPQAGAP